MYPNDSFPRRRPRGRFLFFLPVAVGIAAVVGGAVMLLWNNLMPELFGLKRISFWQALGLLALSRILFGNFGGKGKGGGGMGRMRGAAQMREKWGSMTAEERKAFRDEWKRRCGR